MLFNGKKIEGPNEELIIIPRGDDSIAFTARAVLDMDEFEKLCPRPTPPTMHKRDGTRLEVTNDPKFIKKIEDYSGKRMAFMFLKSLEATKGLQWETVEMDDPSTWENYNQELRDSGFSDVEIQRILLGVMSANCLNETRLDQARKSFLAGLAEANGSLSPTDDPVSTPPGEPAKD